MSVNVGCMGMDSDELDSKTVFEAAKILHLGERASMDEIKARYRDLMKRWHPDNCRHDPDLCKEKAEAIVNAYEVIVAYCSSYVFSFKDSDIINSLPHGIRLREKWEKQYRDDPIWR